jgi:hypothetical protein
MVKRHAGARREPDCAGVVPLGTGNGLVATWDSRPLSARPSIKP